MLLQQRQNRLGLGRAPGQKQGQDMLLLDQIPGIFNRQLRVRLVIERAQFNLLPMNPAFGIDRLQIELGACRRFLGAYRRRTAEAARLANQNLRLDAGPQGRQQNAPQHGA